MSEHVAFRTVDVIMPEGTGSASFVEAVAGSAVPVLDVLRVVGRLAAVGTGDAWLLRHP